MSNNINVKLTFSADTKVAQQQINQLQQTLSNIAATPISGSGLKATAQEIQVATNKALELKVALNNATNVNTGKLNFNKFSQELKRNKTTLQEYAMQLQKLGPQGVQAFSQMATAIRQSETPLVAMQGKLAALGQTFMNTINTLPYTSANITIFSGWNSLNNIIKHSRRLKYIIKLWQIFFLFICKVNISISKYYF